MSTQAAVPVVPEEPTFRCFVQSGACANKALKATEAYVPSVVWLFWMIRFADIDKNNPLTIEEIGPHVRCALHSCGKLAEAYNRENAITAIYPLHKTLALMARWREVQERKATQSLERKLRKACEGLAKPAPVAVPAKPKNYGTYTEKVKVAKVKTEDKKNKGGKRRGSSAH